MELMTAYDTQITLFSLNPEMNLQLPSRAILLNNSHNPQT